LLREKNKYSCYTIMHMPHPIHHQNRRKRIHLKHEKYPHPNTLKNFVDKLIYLVCIFVPFMTLVQLLKIYLEKNASGISWVAYTGYFTANLVWLLYGIVHKEKPIMIMYTLLAILNITIVIGAFLY